MNFSFDNIEDYLVHQGKVTMNQIEEINKIFKMLGKDRNNVIYFNDLATALQKLFNCPISIDETQKIFKILDINGNGVIHWPEFLQAMTYWLETQEKDESEEMGINTYIDRRNFHDKLLSFFYLLKTNKIVGFISEESMDQTLYENWPIQDKSKNITDDEKWNIFNEISQNLLDIFRNISLLLESKENDEIKKGLLKLIELSEIVYVFTKPFEKLQITHFLLKLIDFLENPILSTTLKYLNESGDLEIILYSLKIISFFMHAPPITLTNSKNYKNLLMQNNLLEILLQLIEKPPNYDIKLQSFITLGFLLKGSPQIRDMAVMQNALNVIFKHYKNDASIEEIITISWVLSILSGVTMNIPIYNCEEKDNLIELFIELLFWKNVDEILINSLFALGCLLPFHPIKSQNLRVYPRIVECLDHGDVKVKRGAIFCLKKLIADDDQCKVLCETDLINRCVALMKTNSLNFNFKMEIIHFLKKYVENGYALWVMKNYEIYNVLTSLLAEFQKDEVVKFLLSVIKRKFPEINKLFIQSGFMVTLIDQLQFFKQSDLILVEIYGKEDNLYNFQLVQNICIAVSNLIEGFFEFEKSNDLIIIIDQELKNINLDKLLKIFHLMFEDIFTYNRIDFFTLKQINHDFSNSVLNFFVCLLRLFEEFKNNKLSSFEIHQQIIENLKIYIELLKINFSKIEEKIKSINIITNSPIKEIFVSDIEDASNMKKIVVQGNISLLELLLRIEHLFFVSPIMIYYTSSDSRKYLIENEENWIKVQQINFENSIQLSICDPLGKGVRNYLPNEKTPQIFDYELNNQMKMNSLLQSNLAKHDFLMKEMKEITRMPLEDIEILYRSFVNITNQRLIQQNKGSVNFDEFSKIMKNFFKDENFIRDIFFLLDYTKINQVDFRDFVRLIGILKCGSLEDKLRLYFKTYDVQNKGYLEKNDVYRMLQSSFLTSGYYLSEKEIQEKVNLIFEVADLYHDGRLTYTEFRQAVSKNYIIVNAIWFNPEQINLHSFNYFPQFLKSDLSDFIKPNWGQTTLWRSKESYF